MSAGRRAAAAGHTEHSAERSEPVAPSKTGNLEPACRASSLDEPFEDFDGPDDACTDPGGHSWVYTGTQYGGDHDSYFGEGRCYCERCGADGDA